MNSRHDEDNFHLSWCEIIPKIISINIHGNLSPEVNVVRARYRDEVYWPLKHSFANTLLVDIVIALRHQLLNGEL